MIQNTQNLRLTSSVFQHHSINGDKKLSVIGKIIWLLFNVLNNIIRKPKGNELQLYNFYLNDDIRSAVHKKIPEKASPARRLCDLFWHTLPWDIIAKSLNDKINAVEIGCGSGRYGKLLQEYAPLSTYTGCDIRKRDNWVEYETNSFRLVQANADDITEIISGKNFIFTQSAVEHFESDMLFFKQIADYVCSTSSPVIQIHLVPSVSCLWLYLWHGFRQYSPGKLENIAALFDEKTKATVVALGSRKCNSTHFKFITYPLLTAGKDARDDSAQKYLEHVTAAINYDMSFPYFGSAGFYALILCSNCSNDFLSPNFKEIF